MKKIDKRNNEELYVDEKKHSRQVANKHFIHEIEKIHPLSINYKKYWKEMKRRSMEGYWFEGKWMPGNLYFYINLTKIRLNKDNFSTTKIVGRPFLRDLEWEKAYVFVEARGFSGFRDDEEETCWKPLEDFDKLSEEEKAYVKLTAPAEVKSVKGGFKKYVRAREYLRRIHHKNLGKPLFQNEASNVIDIECFDPETEVLMYDKTVKKIKDILIGDYVQGPTGPRKVVNTFLGESEMYKIVSSIGDQVVSRKHLIHLKEKIKNKWVKKEYSVSELYEEKTLNDKFLYKIIQGKECEETSFTIEKIGKGKYVGIEVDEDNLFLLKNYVVVHNCRGGGKSFFASGGMVLPTWLTDGVYDYDEYTLAREAGDSFSVDVVVAAIDGKYSKDLLDKVSLAMENLEGEDERNGIYYPPPLAKKFRGSWYSGKQFIENKYEVKKGGEWQTKGSGSKIYHRTFKDDPFAGNGIRTSLGMIEEVGFFNILEEALGHMKDTTYDGTRKFGTLYMLGTGGDMEGGSSKSAMRVFNNPSEYDCLCFQDVWEDSGDIGFFVPYELGLNQFKDKETGTTDLVQAKLFVDRKREKLSRGKNKSPLYREMQNNPRVPSEAFLTKGSSVFPTAELKEHLNWLKSQKQDSFIKGQCGELIYAPNEAGEVSLKWKPDLNNRLTPCGYDMKKSDETTGCIQIWEHPKIFEGNTPPHGLYVAGTDPYDQDQADSSASLGSTFIYKTFYTQEGIYEWPVAEYTARPSTAEEHHETVRRLLLYYNAVDMYENERNTLKMHFSHKHSLYLLAKTPTILKATENSSVQRQYGIHMTKSIKNELEIYTRDWLLKEAGDGRLNLHKIYSIPLLEELIYYNDVGNFDRVIAFMLTILHRLQNYHLKVKEVKQEEDRNLDTFLNRIGKFYS